MKIGFGKRILMFLHWFLSLAICILFALSMYFPLVFEKIRECFLNLLGAYGFLGLRVLAIAVGVVYILLCILQAGIIFRRRVPRSERGFITVDSSDNSRVRIAISAIEQMVRQSVHTIDGIVDMKIAIDSADDSIGIKINASIIAGSHVPTITLNMQQAIRRFVEMNCGVAVRKVEVCINAVLSTDAAGRKKHRNIKAANLEETVIPVPVNIENAAEDPISQIACNESTEIKTVDSDVQNVCESALEVDAEKSDEISSVSEEANVDCDSEESIVDKQN